MLLFRKLAMVAELQELIRATTQEMANVKDVYLSVEIVSKDDIRLLISLHKEGKNIYDENIVKVRDFSVSLEKFKVVYPTEFQALIKYRRQVLDNYNKVMGLINEDSNVEYLVGNHYSD